MTARELAMRFEGLRLKAYQDSVGFWTIGYGHHCSDHQPPITEDEAHDLLEADLKIATTGALTCCPKITGGVLEALTDFVFNLGTKRLEHSTLRVAVNNRDWPEARKQIRKWVYAGGEVLPGLVHRRDAEAELIS